MTAGFSRAALERGEATLEDGMLLLANDEALADKLEAAELRWDEHQRKEANRREQNMPTDAERHARTGEAFD